ncbi:hypothetical protein H3C66_05215 [Patescibacteria group bacterium]|nr:hypothetical protein [Patescibacteria group bacterium]
MTEVILVLLVIFLVTGMIQIPGFTLPNFVLFNFNGQPITLLNVLIFLLILWAIGILPSPFREIAGVLFILWLLSIFGFIAIAGLSNLIVIGIIVGIVFSMLKNKG